MRKLAFKSRTIQNNCNTYQNEYNKSILVLRCPREKGTLELKNKFVQLFRGRTDHFYIEKSEEKKFLQSQSPFPLWISHLLPSSIHSANSYNTQWVRKFHFVFFQFLFQTISNYFNNFPLFTQCQNVNNWKGLKGESLIYSFWLTSWEVDKNKPYSWNWKAVEH